MKEFSDEELRACKAQVNSWIDEFKGTFVYQNLSLAAKKETSSAISIFTELMYSYYLLSPLKWTAKALEGICCDVLPRKVLADERFFVSIEPVLTAFFSFLAEKEYLPKAPVLIKRLHKIAPEMLRIADSQNDWDLGKKLFAEAKAEGLLDETDEASLKRSLEQYIANTNLENSSAFAETKREVYQFIITLKGCKPAIWRRLLVPAGITFNKLHKIIQAAFGWQNRADYSFNGQKLSRDKISTFFNTEKVLLYLYDFQNKWQHEIILEKVFLDYLPEPVCLAGARNRPPEEVGGMKGYAEFLKVIKNPNHPEFLEALAWAEKDTGGRRFEPEYFYLNEINRALRRIKC